MSMLSVALVSTVSGQLSQIESAVDGTGLGRVLIRLKSFPAPGDPGMVQIAEVRPEVIIVSMRPEELQAAVKSMELLRTEVPHSVVIAVGDIRQPQQLVLSMRAGAREFLDTPLTQTALAEAFVRIGETVQKTSSGIIKLGKLYAVLGAKGGAGATTVAVNLALSLQMNSGSTIIVDLATHGHVALHLNVRPKYSAFDAIFNRDRLDRALLESYTVRSARELSVLAGLIAPTPGNIAAADVEKMLGLLTQTYSNVVVDLSSRLDTITCAVAAAASKVLLVSQTDVPSIWSANQIINFLGLSDGGQKLSVLLNRYRKISGYSDSDLEAAYGARIAGKLAGDYEVVCRAIDRGEPVLLGKSELNESFQSVFDSLTKEEERTKKGFSLFRFSTA